MVKSVTIVIPVYNEEKNIADCLKTIINQDYPRDKFNVLIAEGGSKDRSVEIIKKIIEKHSFIKLVVKPELSNEETRKPFAVKNYAKGEIIAFIDADNRLPDDKNWLKRMVAPFDDPQISFSDTASFSVRSSDDFITRYNALIGGDDPIASYMKANDRMCYFTGLMIGKSEKIEDKGDYFKVSLKRGEVPAIGSNGFFFRRTLFDKVNNYPLNHTVFTNELVDIGYNKLAKVKTSIVHKQDGSVKSFFKKKLRRIKRRHDGEIKFYANYGMKKSQVIILGLYIATIIMPIFDSIKGFFRKPDSAWLFHPVACLGLLFLYGFYYLKGIDVELK